jgi:CRP-like cAMP-binding protein
MSAQPGHPPDPRLPGLLELAGDEAVLPAGSRLADEERPGRQCFLIIDGRATVERHGAQVRSLGRGDFVGDIDASGGPQPPAGVSIRLETRACVLVLDPARLAALIEAEPALAAAWRALIDGPRRDDGHGGG